MANNFPDTLNIDSLFLSQQEIELLNTIRSGNAFVNPCRSTVDEFLDSIDTQISLLRSSKTSTCTTANSTLSSLTNDDLDNLIDKLSDLRLSVQEFGYHTDRLSGIETIIQTETIQPRVIIEDESGSGAEAVAVVEGGRVVGINILTAGEGYGGSKIRIESDTGIGATAEITKVGCNGELEEIEVTSPGKFYEGIKVVLKTVRQTAQASSIVESDKTGYIPENGDIEYDTSDATPEILETIEHTAGVQSITINSSGAGYTSAPSVIIDVPETRVAVIEPVISSGSVSSFDVTDAGVGYVFLPDVTIAPPTLNTAGADNIKVDCGRLICVDVVNRGKGYLYPPKLTVEEPEGTHEHTFDEAIVFGNTSSNPYLFIPYTESVEYPAYTDRYVEGCLLHISGATNSENNTDYTGIEAVEWRVESVTINHTLNSETGTYILLSGSTFIEETTTGITLVQRGDRAVVSANTVIDGILDLRLEYAGSGYSSDVDNLEVKFKGGSGSGARASVTSVDGSGRITGIELVAPGGGYGTTLPEVYVEDITQSYIRNPARIIPVAGYIESIDVIDAGEGYVDAPKITEELLTTIQAVPSGAETGDTFCTTAIIKITKNSNWTTFIEDHCGTIAIGTTVYNTIPAVPTEADVLDVLTENDDYIEFTINISKNRYASENWGSMNTLKVDDVCDGLSQVTLTVEEVIEGLYGTIEAVGGSTQCPSHMICSLEGDQELISGARVYLCETGDEVPDLGDVEVPYPVIIYESFDYRTRIFQAGSLTGQMRLNAGSGYVSPATIEIIGTSERNGAGNEYSSDAFAGMTHGNTSNPPLGMSLSGGEIVPDTSDLIANVSGGKIASITIPYINEFATYDSSTDTYDYPNDDKYYNMGFVPQNMEIVASDPSGWVQATGQILSDDILNGKIQDITITNAGLGYTNPVKIRIDSPKETFYSWVWNEDAGLTTLPNGSVVMGAPTWDITTGTPKIPLTQSEMTTRGTATTPPAIFKTTIIERVLEKFRARARVPENGLLNDAVETIEVHPYYSGVGYDPDNPPTVTVEEPPESLPVDANAVADCPVDGEVTSLRITNSGSNLNDDLPPSVIILGNGLGAKAEATVENGKLVGLEITDGGSCYTPSNCNTLQCVYPDREIGYYLNVVCSNRSTGERKTIWAGLNYLGDTGIYTRRCFDNGGCTSSDDVAAVYVSADDDYRYISSYKISFLKKPHILIKRKTLNCDIYNGTSLSVKNVTNRDCNIPLEESFYVGTALICSDEDSLDDEYVRVYLDDAVTAEQILSGFYLFITGSDSVIDEIETVEGNLSYSVGETLLLGTDETYVIYVDHTSYSKNSTTYAGGYIIVSHLPDTWNTSNKFLGETSNLCSMGDLYESSIELMSACSECTEESSSLTEWDGYFGKTKNRNHWSIDKNTGSHDRDVYLNSNNLVRLHTIDSQIYLSDNASLCPATKFGYSVDQDGGYAVIGSPEQDIVYLFKRTETGNWIQVTKFEGPEQNGTFGYSVAIHNGRVAVGSPEDNSGKGVVYFFEGADTQWESKGWISFDDHVNLGGSLSIYGDYCLIGCVYDEYDSGRVFVYQYNNSVSVNGECNSRLTWIYKTTLVSSDISGGDMFGFSVDIDGDFVVIGAPGDYTTSEVRRGSAYIFKLTSGTFIEQDKVWRDDVLSFGESVSIDGKCCRVAVGCPLSDKVFIYNCGLLEEKCPYIGEGDCLGVNAENGLSISNTPRSIIVTFANVDVCEHCEIEDFDPNKSFCLEQSELYSNRWYYKQGTDEEILLELISGVWWLNAKGGFDDLYFFRGIVSLSVSEFEDRDVGQIISNVNTKEDCHDNGSASGYNGTAKIVRCCEVDACETVLVQKYDLDDYIQGTTNTKFGTSVSVQGPVVLIGAENSDDYGLAYEYTRNDSVVLEDSHTDQVWFLTRTITSTVEEAGSKYGCDVCLVGVEGLIGAYNSLIGQGYACFYTPEMTYAVLEGDGCDAIVHVEIDDCYGEVSSIVIDNAGYGYRISGSAPKIKLVGGGGCGAKVVAEMEGDTIRKLFIRNGGCDYYPLLPKFVQVLSVVTLANIIEETRRDKTYDEAYEPADQEIDETVYKFKAVGVSGSGDPLKRGDVIVGSKTKARAIVYEWKSGEKSLEVFNLNGRFQVGELLESKNTTLKVHAITSNDGSVTMTGTPPTVKDEPFGERYVDESGTVKYRIPEQTGPIDHFTESFDGVINGTDYVTAATTSLGDVVGRLSSAVDVLNEYDQIMIDVETYAQQFCEYIHSDQQAYADSLRIVEENDLAEQIKNPDQYSRYLIEKYIGSSSTNEILDEL